MSSLKDAWRSRSRPSRPFSLRRSELPTPTYCVADALSEVTDIYPPLKLIFFADDITAFFSGRNEELVESPEKVLKRLKKEGGEGAEAVDH